MRVSAIKQMGAMVLAGLVLAATGAGAAEGFSQAEAYTGHAGKPMHGAAAIESRLERLKQDLKLTADQEPAWREFADQVTQAASKTRNALEQLRTLPEQNAPERMHRAAQLMRERAEQMAATAQAADRLYADLTPEQKALFDRHFARMTGKYPKHHRPSLQRDGDGAGSAAPTPSGGKS